MSPPVLASDDFLQAEAPSPESADPLPSLATAVSTTLDFSGAATAASAPPGATAVVDERLRQGRPLSSGGCSFRVGDVVLASTPGTPNPSEATVVELEPSGGSRLRVAFKDKGEQGGWRNQTDVSGLLRPTDAGQRPGSDEYPTSADAACAARGGDDTASDATAADTDTAADGCVSPPPVTLAFSHLLGKLGTRRVPFELPAEFVGLGRDAPASSCVGGRGADEGDATITDAGGRGDGDGDGAPVARSDQARGRLPVAALGAPGTAEDETRPGTRRAPGAAVIVTREPTGTAPASSSGASGSYRVGDAVLASTAGRPAREATVVERDPSDGSRFRVAFKDKRKKGGWRDKSELSGLAPPADAASAGEQQQLAEGSPAVETACVAADVAGAATAGPVLQTSTPKVSRTATESPRMGSQQSMPRREGPVIKAGTTAAPPALGAAARYADGESGIVERQPRRKRSAATAAAAAISSTAGAGNRVSGSRSSSGDGSNQNPARVKKGVKAKRGLATPTLTAKTPRKKGWQRPKIVTPGSAEGRPEAALRRGQIPQRWCTIVECLAVARVHGPRTCAMYMLSDACGSIDNEKASRPRLPVSGLGSGDQIPVALLSQSLCQRDLFLSRLRSLLTSSTAPPTPAVANQHTQDLAPDGAHPAPETFQGPTAGPTNAQGKGRRERLLLPLRRRKRRRSHGWSRRYRWRPRPSPDALSANPLRSGRRAGEKRRGRGGANGGG